MREEKDIFPKKFIFEEKLPKVNLEVKSGKEVSNNKAMDVYYVFKC